MVSLVTRSHFLLPGPTSSFCLCQRPVPNLCPRFLSLPTFGLLKLRLESHLKNMGSFLLFLPICLSVASALPGNYDVLPVSFAETTRLGGMRLVGASSICCAIAIETGHSCGSLAKKCGIPANNFTKYNFFPKIRSNLMPNQHVCCSTGSLPDYKPKPAADRTWYDTVKMSDGCYYIAEAHFLNEDDVAGFNQET